MTHKGTITKKAWAEIRDGKIVTLRIDFPLGIFPTKEIAELHNLHNNFAPLEIVEVTISYKLPPTKKV